MFEDFTKAQAKRWVAQELAKHTTVDSIKDRIKTEEEQADDPIMKVVAAKLPISTQAHVDLIAALKAKL